MTAEQATSNVGQPFKWTLCVKWDVIKDVTGDGFIIGEFLTAPVEDCRLKQEQPSWLKKSKHEYEKSTDETQPI